MERNPEKNDPLSNITVTLDEGQRQMILLALAELALSRPGFNMAAEEIANHFCGVQMFEEFKRLNADRVKATHGPIGERPGGAKTPVNVDSAHASRHNREFPDPSHSTKEV